MKIKLQPAPRAIALIIVMIVIIGLGVLAGGFAYSMKVEMKLARNSNLDAELEWLGRSGVELARYVLAQQMNIATEPYDSLNQKWAGGPGTVGGVTNTLLADISLEDNQLGAGTFSVKIIDLERKFNINLADQTIIQQGLILMGVDAANFGMISDSIADWIDKDDNTHLSGAESEYYLSLQPSYYCKNGPLDDLTELLLIKGITPAMYWGPLYVSHQNQGLLSKSPSQRVHQEATYPVGLVDLFTTLSARFININTATPQVLQLVPGLDENVARAITGPTPGRAGPDGVDGTDDDTPFQKVTELINVGLSYQVAGVLQQRFSTRSFTFEVHVDARIGQGRKEFIALVRRNSPRDVQVLRFYWK